MLSSFIALAAGMIGAVPITAPSPIAAAPSPVVTERPAVPSVIPTESAPALIPVQGDAPSPTAETAAEETVSDPNGAPAEGMVIAPPAETPDTAAPPVETDPPVAAPPQAQRGDLNVVAPTERRAILKAASDGLARVETARGRFIQFDVNGQFSEGSFALQRPGRMRFDYDDPVPYLMAADGTTVAWRDEELEQVDRVPLSSTPLKMLLNNSINFDEDADVLRVQKDRGQVAITLRDRSGESDDQLTLLFESASYALSGWRVLDANGGITQVQLRNIETGIQLSPRLFIVEDFEDEDDDRRR